jgi:hypothetical protein
MPVRMRYGRQRYSPISILSVSHYSCGCYSRQAKRVDYSRWGEQARRETGHDLATLTARTPSSGSPTSEQRCGVKQLSCIAAEEVQMHLPIACTASMLDVGVNKVSLAGSVRAGAASPGCCADLFSPHVVVTSSEARWEDLQRVSASGQSSYPLPASTAP